jgi:hypothetical protein
MGNGIMTGTRPFGVWITGIKAKLPPFIIIIYETMSIN